MTKRLFGILCFVAMLDAEPALMPQPAQMSLRTGKLRIDGSFAVLVSGFTDRRLEDAIHRLMARIRHQTGLTIHGRGAPALIVECHDGSPEIPVLGEDESYQLEITSKTAHLTAPTAAGVLRGLETFSQLITLDNESFFVPALRIEDHPRFPWRGLMLDVSRHWMPIGVIERNLDAMAAVKLNVFHWHLSDDQGFRVESKLFPRLHQFGSDGNFYTQDEVRQVVAYAADRGIRVVPEFDIPGHTTSWLVGYPELASAPGPFQIERKWGIFEPTMDPTEERVYSFLDRFIGEMSALFPDEYFHIGGDEVLDAEWKRNPAIQEFSKKNGLKTSTELHGYFNRRVHALIAKHGKKMMGWDEVFESGAPAGVVVQSWRGQESLARAARQGYRGILSFGYYLDHLKPAAYHYSIDPLGGEAKQLSQRQAELILGGEACMWTEYVTEETVDSRLWPRAAAIAERLWSPSDVTDAGSMYARLARVSRWLDWTGVEHHSGPRLMLSRLAGGRAAPPLQVLAGAIESLGIEQRQAAREYRSDVPLNRMVDAVAPESEKILQLEEAVRRFLSSKNRSEADEIRLTMSQWSENDRRLRPLLAQSFLLAEVAPLSENLSKAGKIGLRALQYLESGEPAPAEWLAAQRQELLRMEAPRAELAFAAVRPVKALLDALAGSSSKTDQAAHSKINR